MWNFSPLSERWAFREVAPKEVICLGLGWDWRVWDKRGDTNDCYFDVGCGLDFSGGRTGYYYDRVVECAGEEGGIGISSFRHEFVRGEKHDGSWFDSRDVFGVDEPEFRGRHG